MQIYLIRHGKVENPNHVLYGRLPGFHLSEEGRHQVEETAQELVSNNVQIEKIYSSPLERAIETSEILAEAMGLSKEDITTTDDLIEVDEGSYQGMNLAEFDQKYDQIRADKSCEFGNPSVCGKRVLDFINQIPNNFKVVAAVSHWDPIMAVISAIKNDWNFFATTEIKTAGYFVIDNSSGEWRLLQ